MRVPAQAGFTILLSSFSKHWADPRNMMANLVPRVSLWGGGARRGGAKRGGAGRDSFSLPSPPRVTQRNPSELPVTSHNRPNTLSSWHCRIFIFTDSSIDQRWVYHHVSRRVQVASRQTRPFERKRLRGVTGEFAVNFKQSFACVRASPRKALGRTLASFSGMSTRFSQLVTNLRTCTELWPL